MSPETNPYASPAAIPAKKRAACRLDKQTADFYRRYRNAFGAVTLAVGGVIGTSKLTTSDTGKAVAAIFGIGCLLAGAKLSDKKE